MSDLLNKASLVMIPSGYKEDVLYSAVPGDGNGDLSFTRASNGTRVNSAGLVEVCPWNLVQQSEDFSSGWIPNNLTVTTNSTTAPNGTTTADSLTTTTTTQCNLIQNLSFNVGVYTMSIYIKKVDSPFIYVEMGSSYVWFNLTTGANSGGTQYSSDWSYISATSENVGNGWFRFQMVAQCLTAGTYGFRPFQPVASSGSYSPSATNQVTYVWGAQLNIGSTAKPYFPTTDRLNVPRLTYQNGGGGCPSLLLEKQSTNLVTYSEDFGSGSNWNKANQGVGSVPTITANYAISPDGTQNATRFVCNLNGGTSTNDRSWMLQSFTAQATDTISIWIKLNSAGTKTFIFSDSGGNTKTISGTDWQRIDTSFVGASGEYRIGLIGGLGTSDTLDCCIWGAQAEGGSYPTSYIPTTSASATRVVDTCLNGGSSALFNSPEGVLFFEGNVESNNTPAGGIAIIGSSGNRVQLFNSGSNMNALVEVGGAAWFANTTGLDITQNHKYAISWALNDYTFYADGVQIALLTSGATFSASTLNQFRFSDSGVNYFYGKVKQVVIFPTRLTNAELASLTTL